MRARNIIVAVLVLVFCFSLMSSPSLLAEEKKFPFHSSFTVKDFLEANVNKNVSITLVSGEKLKGTVAEIGNSLVHISQLSRMEFYDAVVRIDSIVAVTVRARDKL